MVELGKEDPRQKKGPQNVAIPEALFNVAIRENHFQGAKSRVGGAFVPAKCEILPE
jgi:hypothetical protein